MEVFQRVSQVGGRTGNPFRYVGGDNGKLLRKIGVWAGHDQINAIQVWLADDDPNTVGCAWGAYKEFEFRPGERIKELSLWPNIKGDRVTAIHFRTDQEERIFDHCMTEHSRRPGNEKPIDVGSGICAGVLGNHDKNDNRPLIQSLAFVFLRPLDHARLKNVSYPTLTLDAAPIEPVSLKGFSDHNGGSSPRNWKFADSYKVTRTSSWSLSLGAEVYGKVSVQASALEVVKVAGEFGWKLSGSGTHSASETAEDTLTWEVNGTLQPNESIRVTALTRRGSICVPYTAVMEVVLKSRDTFSYPVQGQYTGLSYTDIEVVDEAAAERLKAVPATA